MVAACRQTSDYVTAREGCASFGTVTMETSLRCALLLWSVLLLSTPVISKQETQKEASSSFDIKPSGQTGHETIRLENGVTCVFTYAAVGGTNEEWLLNLQKTKKNTYTCTAERPEQASYLFFMNFAMSILEHDVLTAEAFDNNGPLLQEEEYMITKDLKSVRYKDGGFQSNLAKVTVTARKPKTPKQNEL